MTWLSAANARILDFEGPVGGTSPDWTAVPGTTAASSNTKVSGLHSLSLRGSTNPGAISAPLTTLGPIAAHATVQVLVPTSLQGQGFTGQILVP